MTTQKAKIIPVVSVIVLIVLSLTITNVQDAYKEIRVDQYRDLIQWTKYHPITKPLIQKALEDNKITNKEYYKIFKVVRTEWRNRDTKDHDSIVEILDKAIRCQ